MDSEGTFPVGLATALMAYLDSPEAFPQQGSPGLRAMMKLGSTKMGAAEVEWVERQQALHVRANTVFEWLSENEPRPTVEELKVGNVGFPAWVGTGWSQLLAFPWASELEQAVEEGEAYVESKKGA